MMEIAGYLALFQVVGGCGHNYNHSSGRTIIIMAIIVIVSTELNVCFDHITRLITTLTINTNKLVVSKQTKHHNHQNITNEKIHQMIQDEIDQNLAPVEIVSWY